MTPRARERRFGAPYQQLAFLTRLQRQLRRLGRERRWLPRCPPGSLCPRVRAKNWSSVLPGTHRRFALELRARSTRGSTPGTGRRRTGLLVPGCANTHSPATRGGRRRSRRGRSRSWRTPPCLTGSSRRSSTSSTTWPMVAASGLNLDPGSSFLKRISG